MEKLVIVVISLILVKDFGSGWRRLWLRSGRFATSMGDSDVAVYSP